MRDAFGKVSCEGGKYRVVQLVRSVKTASEYALEKRNVNRELVCVYGATEKKIKLTLFSNRPITSEEYTAWLGARLAKTKKGPLTRVQCLRKKREMKLLMARELNSEEISRKVWVRICDKVRRGDLAGLNVPYEKSRLREEMGEIKEVLDRKVQGKDRQVLLQKHDQIKLVLAKIEKLETEQRLKQESAVPIVASPHK